MCQPGMDRVIFRLNDSDELLEHSTLVLLITLGKAVIDADYVPEIYE